MHSSIPGKVGRLAMAIQRPNSPSDDRAILAVDEADFRSFRPAGGARFKLLG